MHSLLIIDWKHTRGNSHLACLRIFVIWKIFYVYETCTLSFRIGGIFDRLVLVLESRKKTEPGFTYAADVTVIESDDVCLLYSSYDRGDFTSTQSA